MNLGDESSLAKILAGLAVDGNRPYPSLSPWEPWEHLGLPRVRSSSQGFLHRATCGGADCVSCMNFKASAFFFFSPSGSV